MAALLQFVSEANLINGFKETWTKRAMNSQGRVDNGASYFFGLPRQWLVCRVHLCDLGADLRDFVFKHEDTKNSTKFTKEEIYAFKMSSIAIAAAGLRSLAPLMK